MSPGRFTRGHMRSSLPEHRPSRSVDSGDCPTCPPHPSWRSTVGPSASPTPVGPPAPPPTPDDRNPQTHCARPTCHRSGILGTLARNAPDSEHKPIRVHGIRHSENSRRHLSVSSQDVSPKSDISDKRCRTRPRGDAATCTDGCGPAGPGAATGAGCPAAKIIVCLIAFSAGSLPARFRPKRARELTDYRVPGY